MQPLTDLLSTITLLELPEDAQRALVTTGTESRRAIAANPSTTPAVIDMLTHDDDRETHHRALRRTTDTDLLAERLTRGTVCCANHIMRNPATPVELLDDAFDHGSDSVRLAAFVNPSTPLETRKRWSAAEVEQRTDVGTPLGATVVRSHEALLNNPHLFDEIESFGPVLRRAAYATTSLTAEQHATLRKQGRIRSAHRHPVFHAGDSWAATATTDKLLELRSPAADLWLAESPATDLLTARALLSRRDHHVEPHIIARLLNRFGVQVVPGGREAKLAQTRVTSAAWTSPFVTHYNTIVDVSRYVPAMIEGVELLGADRGAWENVATLARDWNGSILGLFNAAQQL